MTTYFIEASLGNHYQDYYIDARSIEEAIRLARKLYAEEYNVQSGIVGFIKTAF